MSTQLLRYFIFGTMLALAATGFIACSDSGNGGGGTGATITITAPGIVGPQGNLSENPPTLTVINVTVSDRQHGDVYIPSRDRPGVRQYSPPDHWCCAGLGANELDSPDGVPEWNLLLEGAGRLWRHQRSVVGRSSNRRVRRGGGTQPGETQVVFDPLTNGMTLGERSGGTFTDQGWRVETNADFIRYEVPTVTNGYVQWENAGLTPRGANDASHMLFGMWDPGRRRVSPERVPRARAKALEQPAQPTVHAFPLDLARARGRGQPRFHELEPGPSLHVPCGLGPHGRGEHSPRASSTARRS